MYLRRIYKKFFYLFPSSLEYCNIDLLEEMLSVLRFLKGGVTIEYLNSVPLPEFFNIKNKCVKIAEREKDSG